MIPISKQGKVKYPNIEWTRILTGNSQKKIQMSNKHKMISNFVSHQEKKY